MSASVVRRESRRGRIAKACAQCRTAKTRCTFKDGAKACEKCQQRGFECTMHSQIPQTVLSVDNGPSPSTHANLAANMAAGVVGPNSGPKSKLVAQIKNDAAKDESREPLKVETPSKGLDSLSPPSAGSTTSHPTSWMSGDSPQLYDSGNASSYSGSASTYMAQLPISGLSVTDETTLYMFDDQNTVDNNRGAPRHGSQDMHIAAGSADTPHMRMPAELAGVSMPNGVGGLLGSPDLGVELGGLAAANMVPAVSNTTMDSAEYFLNLGVFPEQLTTEMLQSRQQTASRSGTPRQDPMMDAMVNPLMREAQQRFRFQNSVVYATLQAMEPALRPHLGAASRLLDPPQRVSSRNVVNQRILQYSQVVKLFDTFKGNYDHWISLPDAEPQELVDYLLEQCPLLVTTCCCVALRFSSAELWQSIYPSLVRYLTYELAQTLVSLPQNIECLQALTILAKYADVLSYDEFVFDMWYISGMAIQHLETVASLNSQFTYVHMRLWNHLVLAHVANANITGRDVLIDEAGLQRCCHVLDESLSTRFDSCMVAELMIQWLTNKYLARRISYAEFEDGVAKWQREWGVLAQLPIIQFIEPVLLFCCFLARWTHHSGHNGIGSPGSAQTSLNQPLSPQSMDCPFTRFPTHVLERGINDLTVILNGLLNIVQPNYFGCLSDNLHNIGFISAIMAIEIAGALSTRESTPPEQKAHLKSIADLVAQLAQRFKLTSRGKDISRTRYIALLQLLKPLYS